MIIDIREKPRSHRWVVWMDDIEVPFDSKGDAQIFVDRLRARIDAPHVWPRGVGAKAVKTRVAVRQATYLNHESACADLLD